MKRDDLDALATAMGGLSILGCLPGSPGDLAGLKYGDILLEVDGVPTPDVDAYVNAIRERGALMRLRVFRNGAEAMLELALNRSEEPMPPMKLLRRVLASGVLPTQAMSELEDEPLN